MKKFLWVLLTLLILFAMALTACSNDAESGENEDVVPEYVATPEDLLSDEEYVPDPSVTAENEVYLEEYSDAEALLGMDITFPEAFEISRVLIVDNTYVQVEFIMGDVSYMGRYATGLQENMSGIEKGFNTDETVDVDGLSLRLRYTVEEERDKSSSTMGVADSYNTTLNISYMLVQQTFVDAETLQEAMELFIGSVSAAE